MTTTRETKWTPGRYTTPFGSREIYRDGEPFVVLHRATSSEHISPTDVDDFARLIAAAPALHAEIGKGAGLLLDLFARWDTKDDPINPEVEALREWYLFGACAALSAAEGEK